VRIEGSLAAAGRRCYPRTRGVPRAPGGRVTDVKRSEPGAAGEVYAALVALFVACLVAADLTGSKFFRLPLFSIGSYEFVTHSVGMIGFPLTFLLTDLIHEYFGARSARRATYIGLGCALVVFAIVLLARALPVAPSSPLPQPVFDQVFAMSNRLYVASLSAYLIGQLCDIAVFRALKRRTGGRLVWLRATGSTVASQLVDSFVVSFVLLQGSQPAEAIAEVALTGYVLKFVLSLALTPLVYLGRAVMRRQFGLEPAPADDG